VIVQVANGFSGIILLPLSRFVYYGLTMGSGIPVFIQLVVITGIVMALVSLLKISSVGRLFNTGFRVSMIPPVEDNTILYMASQVFGSGKLAVKAKPNNPVGPAKNTNAEKGMVMISAGNIMFANKAFFKITGYEPVDVFGNDFASLVRPDSLIRYTMLSRMTCEEIQQSQGIGIITKTNKNIDAFSAATNENKFDAEGINIFYLKEQNSQTTGDSSMATLFFDSIENVDTLHWIWDAKGIIYLNNSCRNKLPFPLGKIISKPGLILKLVRKEDRETIKIALAEYFNSGKFNEDICCRLESGEEKYFRVTIATQQGNGTYPVRNYAIAYDITDEKRMLMAAEAAALEAEMANNNKTAFLANMSHEIRSPLNGIIGFSELLADKNLTDAERERYLNIVQNNGNALISLLSDLIDISKLESGKLVITNHRFMPARLMDELKYQFASASNGKAENVNIIFSGINNFRDQEIETDPNRLRQILVNLITNAIKFTSKGKIEIGADFTGDEMLFWVKDSGIGIPYKNQKAIFERFRQVDSPDSSPILGFGLGLAISKALVEILGGRLWVESMPDQGSLFLFTIKTNIASNTMETNQINNSSYPYDFKEHTILIAEDIDFSFLYLEAVLRRTGVKILWAQNGREAIEHVRTNLEIDLILMDMHMPVMNGYESTEVISKLRPGLPIIAQTAFVLSEDVKKCYAAGCSGYLAKPIRKEQLLNTLTEYFDRMEQRSETMPAYKVGIG
jgi:signal transduction histidine kinase/ActR/RegA family two-component response regulator